ncbi:DNA/RNA non-specific endonuclease [Oscillibacter sp.]|uniref:DNA/RNA non-specific endonuclease n=1 Tax=Oscillibacter sp. TaxID=1945593 RepID=UPI003392854E
MRKILQVMIPTILACCVVLSGCGEASVGQSASQSSQAASDSLQMSATSGGDSAWSPERAKQEGQLTPFSLDSIPEFADKPYIAVNDNNPYFTDGDLTTTAFETYSALDSLGRCGFAYANVCTETMPTEDRGEIGQIKPTGWHTVKYDNVDGKYLYNRCHLIGYQLTAENANEKNLITGTRYLNVEGMLPFENMVADYVKETSNHVLYRVTPIFKDDNLVASGVLMEAESVEDKGAGVSFNVFVYNNQPGVTIDYATGESWLTESGTANTESNPADTVQAPAAETNTGATTTTQPTEQTYILNTSTHKFHYPSCSSVKQMKDSNKQTYTGNRDDLIAQGYSPCGRCKP